MPTVSVIIPCFNQGQFVDEAVDSVLAQSFADFEIIIVNDGSTDDATNRLLHNYRREKTRVLTTVNQGLAAARNNGIAAAEGRYILPLDADDRILPGYLEKAVAVLEKEPRVGIVYCRAALFGAVETDWVLPEYSLERMLVDNIIFCSAFFRRDDWLATGGYDRGMIYGWEDYEFWLSLIERGRQVVMIPETLFSYRVASDSMVRSKEKWQKVEMFKRIYLRHQGLFADHIDVWIDALLEARDRYHTSRLYVDCGHGISDGASVGRKVELGTRRILFDLSGFQGMTALRFDPVDTYVVMEIDRIVATSRSGQHYELSQIESNALYSLQGMLLFDTEDPQCFLPELDRQMLTHITRLSVELRFLALADQALEHIVAHQKELLQKQGEKRLSHKILQGGKRLVGSIIGSSAMVKRDR
ncbi:MAG: glycosyl transferase [uncultured bacterium]|nr:MAG: glycosyl transferase [uncultured bacterium]